MFKKILNTIRKDTAKGKGQKENPPLSSENPDEEYQIPSLHRREFPMTAELKRRMEEERLRERYQIAPSKTGEYL